MINDSGVHLTAAYQRFDAEAHFRPAPQRVCDDPRARCGEVLTGRCKPHQCPLFGNTCNPQSAFGALMVHRKAPAPPGINIAVRKSKHEKRSVSPR